jgi:uncharacterized membrane protein YphA (DoxX/SURF4 family)
VFYSERPLLCNLLGLAGRLFLAWLWLSSGLAKLQDFDTFQRAVFDYQLLPVWAGYGASYIIPGVEIGLGSYLLLGWWTRLTSVGSALLLTVFCLAILWAMSQGLQIDCGCMLGGNQSQPVGTSKLLENGALISISLLVALWPHHWLSIDQLINKTSD